MKESILQAIRTDNTDAISKMIGSDIPVREFPLLLLEEAIKHNAIGVFKTLISIGNRDVLHTTDFVNLYHSIVEKKNNDMLKLLLESYPNLDINGVKDYTSTSSTTLMRASENGDEEIVHTILSFCSRYGTSNANFNIHGSKSVDSPLSRAILHGKDNIVLMLLKDIKIMPSIHLSEWDQTKEINNTTLQLLKHNCKASHYFTNKTISTSLAYSHNLQNALIHGDEQLASSLITNDNINQKDASGMTALMTAVMRGHRSIVAQLVRHPFIDLSLRDNYGLSALMLSATIKWYDLTAEDMNIHQLLIHAYGTKNVQYDVSPDNMTVMMYAAANNNSKLIQELLNIGLNPNQVDSFGQTALMYAAYYKSPNATTCLLNNKKTQPNMLVEVVPSPHIYRFIRGRESETVNEFRRGRFSFPGLSREEGEKYSYSQTALTIAGLCGHDDIFELMLRHDRIRIIASSTQEARQSQTAHQLSDLLYTLMDVYGESETGKTYYVGHGRNGRYFIQEPHALRKKVLEITLAELNKYHLLRSDLLFETIKGIPFTSDIMEQLVMLPDIDVNYIDKKRNETAQIIACHGWSYEGDPNYSSQAARHLSDKEIDSNIQDYSGKTAAMIASNTWFEDEDEDEEIPDLESIILDDGLDPDIQDIHGKSQLMYLLRGDFFLLNFHIMKNANLNLQDETGKTALMHAIISKSERVEPFEDYTSRQNVNIADYKGRTALMYGLSHHLSSTFFIDWILNGFDDEEGADITQMDNMGMTALMHLLNPKFILQNHERRNRITDVSELVSHLLDVTPVEQYIICNQQDNMGRTPLMHLLEDQKNRRSEWEETNTIIDRLHYGEAVDISLRDHQGKTALMYAATIATCTVNAIIEKIPNSQVKPHLDLRDHQGKTGYIYASECGKLEILKLLMRLEESVLCDYNGMTALMYAAKNGHEPVIKYMLEDTKLFSPDDKDINGKTALVHAMEHNHAEVATYLLRRQREPYQQAWMWALEKADIDSQILKSFNTVCLRDMYDQQLMTTLDERASSVQHLGATDNQNRNLLWVAIDRKDDSLTTILALASKHDAGIYHAFLNHQDNRGMTPLIYAAYRNNSPAFRVLIGLSPVDVNTRCHKGLTSLMYAVKHDNTELITDLLNLDQSRIDINRRDLNGRTALMLSISGNHTLSQNLLLGDARTRVNEQDSDGVTASMLMARNPSLTSEERNNRLSVLNEHKSNEGNAIIHDKYGRSPLDVHPSLYEYPDVMVVEDVDISLKPILVDDDPHADKWQTIKQAIKNGDINLLDNCLRADQVTKTGYSHILCEALSYAAQLGQTRMVNKLLCSPRVNPDILDDQGNTPLIQAILYKNDQTAISLINHDNGTRLSGTCSDGMTAIMHAIVNGSKRMVNYLLKIQSDSKNGCDRLNINTIDKSSMSALMYACQYGYNDIVQAILDCPNSDARLTVQVTVHVNEEAKELVRSAASVAIENNQNHTLALLLRNKKMLSLTQRHTQSKDVSVTTSQLLRWATEYHNIDAVRLLLNYDNRVAINSNLIELSIGLSCIEIDNEIAEMLLAKAVMNESNQKVYLIMAVDNVNPEIFKIILNHHTIGSDKTDSLDHLLYGRSESFITFLFDRILSESIPSWCYDHALTDMANLLLRDHRISKIDCPNDLLPPDLDHDRRKTFTQAINEIRQAIAEENAAFDPVSAAAPTEMGEVEKNDTHYGFIDAAIDNRLDKIQQLVRAGADINAQDTLGMSALMEASMRGHADIVQYLCEQPGIDLTLQESNGLTALMLSAMNTGVSTYQILLNKLLSDNNNDTTNILISTNDNGITPLMQAAFYNNVDLVRSLIDLNADVNQQDTSGKTALMYAVFNDCDAVITYLLTHQNLDLNIQVHVSRYQQFLHDNGQQFSSNNQWYTALQISAIQDNLASFKILFKASNRLQRVSSSEYYEVDSINYQIENILLDMVNTSFVNTLILRYLLIEGIFDPNFRYKRGETLLHHAVRNKCYYFVDLLLKYNADVNTQDYDGNTALMDACIAGSDPDMNIILSRLLTAKEVDVNIQNNKGMTALMMTNSNQVFKMLCDSGADHNIKDHQGLTEIEHAVLQHDDSDRSHKYLCDLFEYHSYYHSVAAKPDSKFFLIASLEMILIRIISTGNRQAIDYLMDRVKNISMCITSEPGMATATLERTTLDPVTKVYNMAKVKYSFRELNLNLTDSKGYTALIYAVIYPTCHELINYFMDIFGKQVNVNLADREGKTPIIHASICGNAQAVERLLHAGAQPNQTDAQGMTALIHATINNHFSIMSQLLHGGTNPNIVDENGLSALHHAVISVGDTKSIQLLLDAGCNPNLTHQNKTPLHHAILSSNCTAPVVGSLLKSGACAYRLDDKAYSPLMYITSGKSLLHPNDQIIAAESLIANMSIYINWRDRHYTTGPYELSSAYGQCLDQINRNEHQVIILDMIIRQQYFNKEEALIDAVSRLDHLLIEKLLHAGAVVHPTSDCKNLLNILISNAHKHPNTSAFYLTQLLVNYVDVNSNLHHHPYRSPVMLAVIANNEAILSLLLATGKTNLSSNSYGISWRNPMVHYFHSITAANLNHVDYMGYTALIHSVYHDEALMVQLLKDSRTDINIQDNLGKTAIIHAIEQNKPSAIALLVEYGANLELSCYADEKNAYEYADMMGISILTIGKRKQPEVSKQPTALFRSNANKNANKKAKYTTP